MNNLENVLSEATPSITLRKGQTEIKIKDPTKLIRKMEEIFSRGVNKDLHAEFLARDLTKKNLEYGVGQDLLTDDEPVVVIPNDSPESFSPAPSSEIRTVNKNAYEIRSDVLERALQWTQWQTEMNLEIARRTNRETYLQTDQLPTSDIVLEVAKKFYAFVENRR